MPFLATLPPAASAPVSGTGEIPPDLASVLQNAPTHPALLRTLPPPAHAAALSEAALSLAAAAGMDAAAAVLAGPLNLPMNTRSTIHLIGRSGVLHLPARPITRAISLGYGLLTQRHSSLPALRPGTVRLVPAHREVILAELDGRAALAVEIAL